MDQEVRLRTATYVIPPVVHMVQGDNGRSLKMILEDFEVEDYYDCVLAVHRPDDSYYEIEALAIPTGNYVSAPAYQAITRPGKVECQLKVSMPGMLISTFDFVIMVHESVVGLPVEQLGYDIYDLIDAAGQIHGQPTAITTAAQMTDHAVIYLYMGSESGYSNGHIYYWNGSAFADGGAYGGSGGGGSVTVDSTMSSTSENPVQNKAIYSALQNKANASELAAKADATTVNAALADKADKVEEVTVTASGAVTQALEAGKIYHFTSASLTSLTITLASTTDIPQYHFDFISGATAVTLTMPTAVQMPDSFSVEANKRYEIDVLNGYGVVTSWTIS